MDALDGAQRIRGRFPPVAARRDRQLGQGLTIALGGDDQRAVAVGADRCTDLSRIL